MSSKSSNADNRGRPADEFDPELDLLQRYDEMIQTQVEMLNGIDDKAAYVARLVSILTGLVLSAASVVASIEGHELTVETGPELFLLGVCVLSFFASLVYAIVTYLSSRFEYGPKSGLGEFMADYHVKNQDYKDMMLRGYSEAIQANRRVVVTNSRRFEKCLAGLLAGVFFLLGAGVVTVLPEHFPLEAGTTLVFVIAVIVLVRYIVREDYLTIERKHPVDE